MNPRASLRKFLGNVGFQQQSFLSSKGDINIVQRSDTDSTVASFRQCSPIFAFRADVMMLLSSTVAVVSVLQFLKGERRDLYEAPTKDYAIRVSVVCKYASSSTTTR